MYLVTTYIMTPTSFSKPCRILYPLRRPLAQMRTFELTLRAYAGPRGYFGQMFGIRRSDKRFRHGVLLDTRILDCSIHQGARLRAAGPRDVTGTTPTVSTGGGRIWIQRGGLWDWSCSHKHRNMIFSGGAARAGLNVRSIERKSS